MNSPSTNAKIHDWLDTLPKTIPSRAITSGAASSEEKRLLGLIANTGVVSDSLIAAMLWLRVGIIEPAHVIVQEDATQLASYLHGVVHRLEGDFWNAKYWFRQIHDKRLMQSLSIAIVEALEADELLELAKRLKIVQGTRYSPTDFVTALEHPSSHSQSDLDQVGELERIAWIEWKSLWGLVVPEAIDK